MRKAPPPITVPFSSDRHSPEPARSIKLLSAEEMAQHDRDLLADAEGSIQEKAGFQSLDFNEGEWTYHQLVCPALPDHLLLRFSRNEGTREMSMFSAAIPRNGEGRVRIIPIVRKGYSLFSPAPIGPLTISAFNHIRGEENQETPPEHPKDKDPSSTPSEQNAPGPGSSRTPLPDWLGTGLCYAALAGADPRAMQVHHEGPESKDMPVTIGPTLLVAGDGGATVRFVDAAATPKPMEWNLIFDRRGKLLKATHVPANVSRYQARAVPTRDIDALDPH